MGTRPHRRQRQRRRGRPLAAPAPKLPTCCCPAPTAGCSTTGSCAGTSSARRWHEPVSLHLQLGSPHHPRHRGSEGTRGRASAGHRHPVAAHPVRDHHARCRAPDHGSGFRDGPAHRRDSGRARGEARAGRRRLAASSGLSMAPAAWPRRSWSAPRALRTSGRSTVPIVATHPNLPTVMPPCGCRSGAALRTHEGSHPPSSGRNPGNQGHSGRTATVRAPCQALRSCREGLDFAS